jgi:hypothetical protein
MVVVPVDIEQGDVGHGYQKGQIFGAEVTAGEDEVHAVQPPGGIVIPKGGAFRVGNQ